MGYLDLATYEKLVERQKSEARTISADLLEFRGDRTLTLGKNSNGTTIHVFLQDRKLCLHEYVELNNGDGFTVNWVTDNVLLSAARPSFYALPRATDEEFAELMFSLNYGLTFTEYFTKANDVSRNAAGYFGLIHHMP